MNTFKIKKKRFYVSPEVIFIELDKEISLALESFPPLVPDETLNSTPEYFNNNSFQSNLC